jgi:chromosome segregation ATPase
MTAPTPLSPEVIEELRQRALRATLYEGHGELSDLPEQLADALADLSRQVAEKDAEINKLVLAIAEHVTVRGNYYERIIHLEAELERLIPKRDEFGASVVILADDLADARAEADRLTREKAVLQEHADGLQSSWRGTYGDVVNQLRAAERERYEAYATVKRVWQALGCERYEDARGMHISELVEELRCERDRYKALAEGERERCAKLAENLFEDLPAIEDGAQIARAIRSLPAPTLPEESGDRDHHKALVDAEREAIAAEARRYASHYPQGSDGRNTFILLAEWIERRAAPTLPEESGDG